MSALQLKLNSFSGVGAGQTASLVLSNGPFYQDIYLKTNVSIANIESVKLKLNTVELFDLTGTQLRMMQAYYNIPVKAGFFTLPISASHSPELQRRLSTGLATFAGDNLVLEVKIAAGAIAPTIEAFADVRANPGFRPFVRRFLPFTIPAAGAGESQFTSFTKGPRIMAAYFNKADMTKLVIERDKNTLFELESDANNFLLEREGRIPQAGYFHFDPTRMDYPIDEAFVTASQDLSFKVTVGTGGNIPVIFDCIDSDPRLIVAKQESGMGSRRRRA
jgi:hypothetical protein